MKRLFFACLVATACLLFAGSLAALPRMALTAGSPCATCHIAPQGGGLRTEIGWGEEHFRGMIGWQQLGLEDYEEAEDYGFMDGRVLVGFDARTQVAKMGAPREDKDVTGKAVFDGYKKAKAPDRLILPMQLQPYLAVLPTDWLTVSGSVNFSYFNDARYAGMTPFDAALTIHGDSKLPELRVGMIQPSIGVRHDDHTMMIRADAANPRLPIIAPNYNELGAELHYHPISWLKFDVGGFDNSQLRAAMAGKKGFWPKTDEKRGLAYLGRVTMAPQVIDYGINSWLGVSHYASGDFAIGNAFFGVGKDKVGALMIEASRATRAEGHQTLNWMAMLSVPVVDWLIAEVRVEKARTEENGATVKAEQFVVGAQFFPMPYLELRPEYRLMKTDEYVLGQYTLQIHMFF